MTEAEWLACVDPDSILFHPRHLAPEIRRRKLALFMAAYLRQRFPEESRSSATKYEREAEEISNPETPCPAKPASSQVLVVSLFGTFPQELPDTDPLPGKPQPTPTLADPTGGVGFMAACSASKVARTISGGGHGYEQAFQSERKYQCLLLRDIFGNPFRSFQIDPAWLRWRDGAIVYSARTIYDERRFQDLPILADALEEAGCTDGDILGHCRGPAEHVRGCWVVDAILGKE